MSPAPKRVPLPPVQVFTVVTREITYRTVKVRARTPEAAIERADSTDDWDTYTEGDGIESVHDEQGNEVTPVEESEALADPVVEAPWCEACRSWHHPDNPTCRAKGDA